VDRRVGAARSLDDDGVEKLGAGHDRGDRRRAVDDQRAADDGDDVLDAGDRAHGAHEGPRVVLSRPHAASDKDVALLEQRARDAGLDSGERHEGEERRGDEHRHHDTGDRSERPARVVAQAPRGEQRRRTAGAPPERLADERGQPRSGHRDPQHDAAEGDPEEHEPDLGSARTTSQRQQDDERDE
jgi:hypothetical protein